MTPPRVWDGLIHRRDLLRVGAMAVGASLLPEPFVRGAEDGVGKGTAQSVILLWLAGGVTHIDSFDPKPDAPEEIRGTLASIQTSLTGVRFCEPMPCLARTAHHLALVRSFSHDSNDHLVSQAYALSGRRIAPNQLQTEPNIGAIVNKLHGPRSGFP